MIPPGARVADVGTDHARLPVYLVQRGLAAQVLATDASPEPLRRARSLLARCGLDGVIPLLRADGLSGLPLHEIDTVVMAGLGADTILNILRKTPPPAHVTCLLQPMSHAERLRAFFGAAVAAERLAQEGSRLYSVMAVLPGQVKNGPLPPGRRYVSRALEKSGDPLLGRYLDKQIARLTAETKGLAASKRPGDAALRAGLGQALGELRTLKGRLGY
jgi:tRNA (adenine22-N1)-methyltransferase